jgi:hypothetical protein
VESAGGAASALESLDECSDARALSEPMPLPAQPEARQRVTALQARLDRLRALTVIPLGVMACCWTCWNPVRRDHTT